MDDSQYFERLPPLSANIGQACYKCFAEESANVSLQKCSKCRRVGYCGSACQRADWSKHKSVCKAVHAVENDKASLPLIMFESAIFPEQTEQMSELDEIIEGCVQSDLRAFRNALGREPDIKDRNLFGWEPRCAACGITDRIIRMQAEKHQFTSPRVLRSCPTCRTTFYCSDHHWELVKDAHSHQQNENGYGNLTQCQLNQQIREDIRFANVVAGAPGTIGAFMWAPERVKPSWTSLRDSNWDKEFLSDMKAEFQLPLIISIGPFLRGASDGLSLPMTILWALEVLNGDDLTWTSKETLFIHVIGAAQKELSSPTVFEEILHRLPKVHNLQLLLCGPELGTRDVSIDMDTCPHCARTKRKMVHDYSTSTYHDFVAKQGDAFIKPDLAVAFNSGSSEEAVASWKPTIGLLVQQHIPTVFTSFNPGEANAEARILQDLGATLIPELGPVKNPWGSNLLMLEPNKVTGFYAHNAWLAGGFK